MELFRSLLFVPAHRERLLEKAPGAGADGLLLDLEDSVPAAEKPAARERAGEMLQAREGPPRYVRINGFEAEGGAPDALLAECRDSPHGAAILARFGALVGNAEAAAGAAQPPCRWL